MDVDESLETYQRTAEDVKSMINYAKLDENHLTNITQAIYFPSEYINLDNLKLLELNSHLLMQIQQGEILQFKGGLNEKIVLCTNDKTYDVKEAEISNSILLIPDLKLAQSTSTSPLKSPTGAVNRSKDNSIEDEDIEFVNGENNINRILENRNVSKIFHEYFECREVKPRYRKLNDLLQLTRYSGPENEQFIDKNLLFTFEQFLNTIQCSRREFEAGLKIYRAIKINNRIRILENQYEYRVINLMLGLINENSWLPNEIDKDETLNLLNEIVSREIIEGLFDLYTIKNDGNPIKYEYREDMICRIIAQNILQQGLKFHIDEFMTTWQEALPEGMKVDEKYLCGIGIVDRESKPTCVRGLLEINLSTNLMERLKILFKLKEQWTLQQIEPYIEYFTTPQLSISAILAKYARSMTDTISKRRIYVSKY